MSFKSTFLVIIISIIVGMAIYFFPMVFRKDFSPPSLTTDSAPQKVTPPPTPLLTPNPVIIDEKSNLKEEINRINIPDFKEDFIELKSSVN